MAPERVLEHLKRRLPHFEADGPPVLHSADARADVWQVPGRPASVVVKTAARMAAEMAAAVPPGAEVEASAPTSLLFEARSLEVLGPTGALAAVSTPDARPPRLIDYDEDADVVVQEDVGVHPDLGQWLEEGRAAGEVGRTLGRFVGALHGRSRNERALAGFFAPDAVAIGAQTPGVLAELCRRAGLETSDDVLARVEATARRPGGQSSCLVVGRLGPTAVLVTPDGLRVVDWTGAHFGSPAEDIGYLTAHLWMRIHRAPTVHAAVQASIILRDFLEAYAAAIAVTPGSAFDAPDVVDCAVHFGTALLVNALGPHRNHSLYDGLPPESPIVQEAAAIAVRHLRAPEDVDMFSLLRPMD